MTDRYDELRAALDVAILDLDAAAMPTKSEVFVRLGTGAADLRDAIKALASERDSLLAALNTPELDDFARGVVSEAQHQRARHGAEHDAGKEPLDWFWLVGYLAQKAATAAMAGDHDKAKHHTISTAAALANWHAHLIGANSEMRPGVDADARGFAALTTTEG